MYIYILYASANISELHIQIYSVIFYKYLESTEIYIQMKTLAILHVYFLPGPQIVVRRGEDHPKGAKTG